MSDPLTQAKELERKYAKKPKHNATEKGPRHYAAEILALPESERAQALQIVPGHLFTWVLQYINDPTAKQREINSMAASIAKINSRENRVAALEKVPSDIRQDVKQTVISMMKAKLEREAIQNEQ